MRRWFSLVLLAVLLIPSVAGPTGTLVIPQTIANLAAGNQPASLLDQNWTAIQTYVNNREITIGLAAARPSAGTSGRYYFATDTSGGTLYVDTGSTWQQIAPSLTSTLAEQLTGLGLSNGVTAASTTFGIATGAASSDDATVGNRILMTLNTAYTKTTAAWAVGTGNGCLDTGTIAGATTYHVFLIQRTDTGVVDVLCSAQVVTAPIMPTNYTKKRRLGSLITSAGSEILYFVQDGDFFQWATVPALNFADTNPGTSALTKGLTVPLGVNVIALVHVEAIDTGGTGRQVYFSDLAVNDTAPSVTVAPLYNFGIPPTASADNAALIQVRTNTLAQIRYRAITSGANFTLRGVAVGWWDRRGSR